MSGRKDLTLLVRNGIGEVTTIHIKRDRTDEHLTATHLKLGPVFRFKIHHALLNEGSDVLQVLVFVYNSHDIKNLKVFLS